MNVKLRNKVCKPLIWLMSIALMLSIFPPGIASAQENYDDSTPKELKQPIETLKAIEEIPDELLESGDSEAINQYFNDRGITSRVYNPEIGEKAPMIKQPRGWWNCSLAIGELVLMNAIPIAKLTKIKKYIKELGGAIETAKLLVGATTAKEKIAALTALIAELTGFTNVKNACNL